MTTLAEKRHMDIVARIGCVICREYYGERTPCDVHHIAPGSEKRSSYMTAGLCWEHHKGPGGLHSGVTTFLRVYRLPTEYHLLGLVNKFRAEDGI
jgi:hypothetical protein